MKKIILLGSVLIFSLFFGINVCLATEVGSKLDNNLFNELNSNIVKNKDNKKTNMPKASNEDIFGDEQAFPFIAGLGKNAAH